MREAVHVLVSGIVQGVGYRNFTDRNARELGLSGWVRNLYDGRVEARLEGEPAAIEEMLKRLRRGPRSAEVSDLRVTRTTSGEDAPFRVRRDADEPELPGAST